MISELLSGKATEFKRNIFFPAFSGLHLMMLSLNYFCGVSKSIFEQRCVQKFQSLCSIFAADCRARQLTNEIKTSLPSSLAELSSAIYSLHFH